MMRPDLKKKIDQISGINDRDDHDHRREKRSHEIQLLSQERDGPERPKERRKNDRHGEDHAGKTAVDQKGHHDQDEGNDRHKNHLVALDQINKIILFDRRSRHVELHARLFKIAQIGLQLFDERAVGRRAVLLRRLQVDDDIGDLSVLGNDIAKIKLITEYFLFNILDRAIPFEDPLQRRHGLDAEHLVLDIHRVREADHPFHLIVAGDTLGNSFELFEILDREKIRCRHGHGDHLVAAVFDAILLVILVLRGLFNEERFHGRVDRKP